MIHCVLYEPNNSVAVVGFENVKAGSTLTALILDEEGPIEIPCKADIPLGHTVATKDLAVGDTEIKCGVYVGKVLVAVKTGEHAYVHNIKTKR
jgi:(2R)-sulfolactate sulfo-lyase subunit alpha